MLLQVQESDDMSSGVLIFFDFRALEPFAEADHDHLGSGLMDGFDGRSNVMGIGLVFDAIGDVVGTEDAMIFMLPLLRLPIAGGRLAIDIRRY